jgi:hypothetical protein
VVNGFSSIARLTKASSDVPTEVVVIGAVAVIGSLLACFFTNRYVQPMSYQRLASVLAIQGAIISLYVDLAWTASPLSELTPDFLKNHDSTLR